MLTLMREAQSLVQDARARAGLSTREMAARARVSPSTISRVENGHMDPTLETLRTLLRATGIELEVRTRRSELGATRSEPAQRPVSLADLHDAWFSTRAGARPDWTRLRAFLDYMTRHPELVAEAIEAPPKRTRSRLMNALLAGVADKLADDIGIARPSWTQAAGVLKRPWLSPGTPRMHRIARERAPSQLLARNIAVRADSLWRPKEPVGA